MASYKIEIKKSVQKEIRKLPKVIRDRVVAIIEGLYNNPIPDDSKKLRAQKTSTD